MRFHGDRAVSRACVSGVTPPKPREISSRIRTRRTNQICCSRDRNRSCRRAGRARACSRNDRRGVGSITLNTITTAHFVSIRDVTAAKTRLGSSNRGAPSALSLTCYPVQPRSELPACESFMCACAMRGDECKAEGSRLVRSKPLASYRFWTEEATRRANLKLRLNSD